MSDETKIDDVMTFDEDSGFVSADASAPEAPAAPAPTPMTGADPTAGMDQLRGILLGPITQDLQLKLTQLGQRLDGSMLELDRRTAERVEAVENALDERLDAITVEMSELREEQAAAVQRVVDDLQAGTEALTEQMDALAERLTTERRAEMDRIKAELEKLSETLTMQLVNENQVMRSEMVDRDSLSAALSEIALRLSSGSEIIVAENESGGMEMDLEAAIEAASRQE